MTGTAQLVAVRKATAAVVLLGQEFVTDMEPTSARPGSQEKLRVLIERYERGEALHHPEDHNIFPERSGGCCSSAAVPLRAVHEAVRDAQEDVI